MTESGGEQVLDALYSTGAFQADRNHDGYPDDLRARIVFDGEPDSELWCAVLDLAARLGLETSGISFPLVVEELAGDHFPIVVRPGDAQRPEYRDDGWSGRPAVVAEGPGAVRHLARVGTAHRGQSESSRPPVTEPVDLSDLFEAGGLLVDADGDGAPNGTRLCVVVPPDLPREVGAALVDFAARLGLESGGVDLPVATTGPAPSGAIPLHIALGPGEPARLTSASGERGLEVAGDPAGIADLLRLLARYWPQVPGSLPATDVLAWLRRSLAGWTPDGRAALLREELASVGAVPDGGALRLLVDEPGERSRLARVARETLGAAVPILGPGATQIVFQQEWSARWEGDRALDTLRELILPRLTPDAPAQITMIISEPLPVRRRLERAAREALAHAGFATERCEVRVLDAFKTGLSWLREAVLPRWKTLAGIDRVVIRYRPLTAPETMQALDLRIRWLQELFPADEILAPALGLPLERISLEEWDGDEIYAASALDASGRALAHEEFSPLWYRRPYIGRYADAGTIHVTTGGIIARQGDHVVRERVPTDLDAFWDYFQGEVLPRLATYITERSDGTPRAADQPFFDELRVEVTISEVDEPFGIREEQCSAAEALHEDIYFNTLDFVESLGQHTDGERLSAPGTVIPIVHVRPGQTPHARVTLRGRPRSVARLELGALARPIGAIASEPAAPARIGGISLDGDQPRLDIVLTGSDAKTTALLAELADLRPPQPSRPTLAVHTDDGQVFAIAAPLPDSLPEVEPAAGPTPDGVIITEENLLPLLARLGRHDEVRVSLGERSYQGRPIPAVEVTAPMTSDVWSARKLSLFKPTFLIVARHHANEVASTTAALKLVELLTEDPAWRPLLDRVNVALIPYENADGAALHACLQREHPLWKHHPARYNAVGFEFAEHLHDPDSPYGEARVRGRLWRRWLPDVVVDNHGVPSHEWAQVFAGFGSPPRFRVSYWLAQALIYGILFYLDDPAYPEHRSAAYALRDAVARAVAADADLRAWNQAYYERYVTWGASRVPERFPAERHGEMIFNFGPISEESPARQRAFTVRYPRLTVISWVTEVGDETVHGAQLERTARAHLTANRATLDLLAAAATPPERQILEGPDGTRIRLGRRRPIHLQGASGEAEPSS